VQREVFGCGQAFEVRGVVVVDVPVNVVNVVAFGNRSVEVLPNGPVKTDPAAAAAPKVFP
jgi:hypothetical protein